MAIHFGQPHQRDLDRVTPEETKGYLAEGHFAAGSMLPKIEACLQFLEQSTNPKASAVITNPETIRLALLGRTGTHIVTGV